MKLRLKVLLYIIVSTAIIFILSVGFINYRYWNYTRQMAIQIADLYSKQSAISAQNILEKDLEIVKTLENIFKGYKNIEKETRIEIYKQALADVLANNTDFIAVWTSWELNAIDLTWALPYGRKRTTAYWDEGTIKYRIDTADIDGDIPGSAYMQLKTGVEINMLTNPYFDSYTNDTGSTFLETSIAKGIFVDENFAGAVGIDVSLERFQDILKELKPFKDSRILIVSNDGTIVATYNKDFQGKQIDKIYPEYNRFDIMKKIKAGQEFNFYVENKNGTRDYISFFPIRIEDSKMPWSLGFIVSTDVIIQNIKQNSIILLIISIAALIIISLIIWIVLSVIVSPIEKATKTLESLSIGNANESLKIKYNSKDELGRMSVAVNILIDSLLKTQKFAQQIGKGNLKTEYELSGKHDVLGRSLIEMRDNLVQAQIEETKRQDETQRISWMQTGITEVNEILREKSDNVTTLASELIKFLVNYTKSVQGGFYLIEEKDGKNYINLKSAFAFDRKKELKARLEMGEGLVGRVIKEKQPLNISNLPEGYLYVRSGLGDKSPKNLVIIPLIFEDTVLGAFELASFEEFEEFDLDFLNQIAVRITSSVSVLLKNVETSNLLKESQLQTATFEMKERQFMRQRKRLSEKQKNVEIKAGHLDAALEAMKTLGLFLELDEEKNIVDTNDYLLKEFEITKEDIIGKNITDITVIEQESILWITKFWEDVVNGQTRKKLTVYEWGKEKIELTDTCFIINNVDSKRIIIIGIKNI